jgi:hypothetical protein
MFIVFEETGGGEVQWKCIGLAITHSVRLYPEFHSKSKHSYARIIKRRRLFNPSSL